MPKSVRKVSPLPKKKPSIENIVKPEDQYDDHDIDARIYNNGLKHNVNLKEDDNGNRGERHIITCVCCGKPKYEDYFYLNKFSYVFTGVYNRIPVCKDCLESLYRRYTMTFDQKASTAAIISIMDMPFVEAVAHTHMEDGKFKIGNYAKAQNLVAFKDKSFIDSIASGCFSDIVTDKSVL
jgi:hypothetical protein